MDNISLRCLYFWDIFFCDDFSWKQNNNKFVYVEELFMREVTPIYDLHSSFIVLFFSKGIE